MAELAAPTGWAITVFRLQFFALAIWHSPCWRYEFVTLVNYVPPSVVNSGEQGVAAGEGCGEDALSAVARHALSRVDLDPFQPRAGGPALEDES